MYSVSSDYIDAIACKVRRDSISGTLTLAHGGTVDISDDNLVRDSLRLSKELCSGKYRIGTFDLACLRFGIFIDNALGLDLTGAEVELTYSIVTQDGGGSESVPLGKFLVDPVLSLRRKDILSIVAYDSGVLFDKKPSDDLRALSGTPAQLIIAACTECGVDTQIEEDSFDGMPGCALIVCPNDRQIQTCRDIVMWCSALLCGYAMIDRAGMLTVIPAKYDATPSGGRSVIISDRDISAQERESICATDTRAYIKYLSAYVGNNVVSYTSEYVSPDEQAAPAAYALEKNPLLADCTDVVCDAYNRQWLAYIDGFKQRGIRAKTFGDPAIDPGDTVMFRGGDVDQRDGVIGVVTSFVWNYRNYMDIECLAAECCGSLVSSGNDPLSGVSAQVRSQISKRVDALTGDDTESSVGEFMDDAHTAERFNDYREHSYNQTQQKWVGGNHSDMKYDHVEGFGNKVTVENQNRLFADWGCNHVEGYENFLEGRSGYGQWMHLEGYHNSVGKNSYASSVGGLDNNVEKASICLVHGRNNNVESAYCSAIFGEGNTVGHDRNGNGGSYNGVFGNNNVVRRDYCVVIGYGIDTTQSERDFYFAVNGNVSATTPRFTVDGVGNCYGWQFYAERFHTSGADYAEYFEWADGNPDCKDRCGMLVELSGDKIIPAHGDDIFGIVSAVPSVCANAFEEHWHGRYRTDVYGRIVNDSNGEPVTAPDFDPARKYIPRSKRPEWAAVGITGRLVIADDGSCKVGGYVSARHGIGTSCSKNTGVRVLRRIDGTHVEVVIK